MADYIPARPTVYKGIKMRSRLEAGFARWLDSWPFLRWQYEPCAFGSTKGQYLPDFVAEGFRCAWQDGIHRFYFEVKPSIFGWQAEWDEATQDTPEMDKAAKEEDDLHERMACIWDSDPGANLVVARQRQGGYADFTLLSTDNGFFVPSPIELIAGDDCGYIPAFAHVGAPAVPPWPNGYWKHG